MVSSKLRRAGAKTTVLAQHRDGPKGQGEVEAVGIRGSFLPHRGDEHRQHPAGISGERRGMRGASHISCSQQSFLTGAGSFGVQPAAFLFPFL